MKSLIYTIQKPDNIPNAGLQRKRLSSEGASSAKQRKHSPIRFTPSGDQKSGAIKPMEKRDTISYYKPPGDQFSKKFSNGGGFDEYQGAKWGRGSKRGRGQRRGGRRWWHFEILFFLSLILPLFYCLATYLIQLLYLLYMCTVYYVLTSTKNFNYI